MSEVEKRVTAVLVAAGSSTRMGFDKLSFDLGGETVVQRSIRAFAECPLVDEIVLEATKGKTGYKIVEVEKEVAADSLLRLPRRKIPLMFPL